MKHIRMITAVILALLCAVMSVTCACAADIRPLPVNPEPDLKNGEYRLTVRDTDRIGNGGYFTAALFVKDLYDTAQILSLSAGDTVLAGGRTWTVKGIIPHTVTDSDEIYAYEIDPEEETYSYLAFEPLEDGTCIAVIDDWVPVTPVGEITVMLPLPDRFTYISYTAGEQDEPAGAEAFLKQVGDSFNAYNTGCVLEDGMPVQVTHSSYPWGPEEITAASVEAVPVWKFCHGVRDGLETAVIRGYETDCETGLIETDFTAEETEQVRALAVRGFITGQVSDMSVTGGTRVYTFEDEEGRVLLSVEMYRGLIVTADGMYSYGTGSR